MRRYFISLIFLTLVGCSFRFFVVPNLDYFITKRLLKDFDLSSSETALVKKQIQSILEKYKEDFRNLKQRFEAIKIDKVNVLEEFKYLGHLYYKVSGDVSPILAKIISGLDNKQQEEFFKKQLKKNSEIQERLDKRTDSDYLERYRYFFGDLNDVQIEMITKEIPNLKSIAKNRLKMRTYAQNRLKEILSIKNNEERTSRIQRLFIEVSDRRELDKERIRLAVHIQEFLMTLGQKQVSYFYEKRQELIGWIDSYLETEY